jgi:cobalt-zinc-cadmium efflux system protein
MSHDHHNHEGLGHSHAPRNLSGRIMGAAVTLTLLFVAIEALFGWRAHSLALLSDTGHNLTDAAALGFSWYALWLSKKPSVRPHILARRVKE